MSNSYLTLPIFAELDKATNILLAGAGGGFDIFAGLPLYFGLRQAGKQVHLANLSFAAIYASSAEEIAPGLVKVEGDTTGDLNYFPEIHLAKWLAVKDNPTPVYCFQNGGAALLREAYRALVDLLKVDAVVLIDGGTDSLMRGDEAGLGTPQEDIASIAAVDALKDVTVRLLVCLGFGVDSYHGVSHAHFLEAVADLTTRGGFLGTWSLLPTMPEVQLYLQVAEYVNGMMSNHPSIVTTSITSALEGHFGDYHKNYRTRTSKLFINPLMTLYWAFGLEQVARRCLYLDQIRDTRSYTELSFAISQFRAHLPATKPWTPLPM